MSARDEADEEALDHPALPDDDLSGLREELVDEPGLLLDPLVKQTDVRRRLGGGQCVPSGSGSFTHRTRRGP